MIATLPDLIGKTDGERQRLVVYDASLPDDGSARDAPVFRCPEGLLSH